MTTFLVLLFVTPALIYLASRKWLKYSHAESLIEALLVTAVYVLLNLEFLWDSLSSYVRGS